jgi:hypothetical protein
MAMSQKAVISFDEKAHDFGKVKEEDGKITYVFDFVNKGKGPLVVNRVQASCGCTTPVWTKEPIEPGKKGTITVTYNPAGRPGAFTKNITVYSNATDEQSTLTIHGEVIPKQSAENSAYPVSIGGLALKAKVIQMNNVDKGKIQTRVLEIQNTTKAPLKPSFENLPPHLTAAVLPETLKPNEDGKITFTLNSKSCNQWGPVSDEIYLSLNGVRKFTDDSKIIVVSNIVEDFSKLTLDQKRKSPILEMPEREVDLGIVKMGSRKSGKLKVNNKGQNALEIRRLINNNKELSVKVSKNSISSTKRSDIIVNLDTKNLTEGEYKKSFTMQTNDPENSFLIIVVGWKVQK